MHCQPCFILVTSGIGNYRTIFRAAEFEISMSHYRMFLTQCDEILVESENRTVIIHLAFCVNEFVVWIDTQPRSMLRKSAVWTVVPLHRRSCIITADTSGFCQCFFRRSSLFDHGFIIIAGINVIVIIDRWEGNIGHSQFFALENKGAAVTVAENGQAALDAFLATGKEEAPLLDAILMDVVMPVMDGLQAARAIRESSHPQAKVIPIIAQTANAFAEDVQRTQQAGMNDHISKPLNEAALLRVLAQYYRPQQ